MGNAHATSELCASNLTQAELVEVSQEFSHTNSELFDLGPQFGENILNITRLLVADEGALKFRSSVI